MDPCPECGAERSTPLGCGSCGALSSPDPAPTPFQVFGLEPAYDLDASALKKRLLELSRLLHPDFYGDAAPEVRELAERNSAVLNEAFEVLSDDARRAEWLVAALGGPDEQTERQMPQAFLAEVLEWNEQLEQARTAGGGAISLDPLEANLRDERRATLARIAASLTPLPADGSDSLTDTRRQLNALRYLDRALGQIADFRLQQASST